MPEFLVAYLLILFLASHLDHFEPWHALAFNHNLAMSPRGIEPEELVAIAFPGHEPPQSTSVSPPLTTSSSHVAATQTSSRSWAKPGRRS